MSSSRDKYTNGTEQNSDTSGIRPTPGQRDAAKSRVARIRALNDWLRTTGRGGIVQMTNGIAALGRERVAGIFKAISEFDDFSDHNDPWGEHDCAIMDVDEFRIIWKIDYYDRSRTYHSPDPANPKVTVRVLTVMLAEEY